MVATTDCVEKSKPIAGKKVCSLQQRITRNWVRVEKMTRVLYGILTLTAFFFFFF